MTKVLVLYYSSYGHIETMAGAVAEGAREGGAEVDINRVPELVPDEVTRASHYKMDQAAPVATAAELVAYDAIIVGVGTRYGRMASQMATFGTPPAGYGRRASWSARWVPRSPPPPASTAGRRRPSWPYTPCCSTTA